MNKHGTRRPFYKKGWFWTIIVALLLIGGGGYWASQSTTKSSQDDRVEKTADKKKETAKKESTKKDNKKDKKKVEQQEEADQATPAKDQPATAAGQDGGAVNQQTPVTPPTNSGSNTGNGSGTAPVTPGRTSESLEPWVDLDNFEPNQIIGDKTTMYCYPPGQYPDEEIKPENRVYFDSLKEAQEAGYQTVQ